MREGNGIGQGDVGDLRVYQVKYSRAVDDVEVIVGKIVTGIGNRTQVPGHGICWPDCRCIDSGITKRCSRRSVGRACIAVDTDDAFELQPGRQDISQDNVVGRTFRQTEAQSVLNNVADTYIRTPEIGIGNTGLADARRQYRDRCGNGGFVIVNGVAGVGKCTVSHTVDSAVCADGATAIQGCGSERKGLPTRLQGIAQDFFRLNVDVDTDREIEIDCGAGCDGVFRVTGIPSEDRAIGTQRGVDNARRIRADIHIGHLGTDQVIEHPQVIGRRITSIGCRDGNRQYVTGVGAGRREGLGQHDVWFPDLGVHLGKIPGNQCERVQGVIRIVCQSRCVRRAVVQCRRRRGIGNQRVFHSGNKGHWQRVACTGAELGQLLVTKVPGHDVIGTIVGTGSGKGTARGKTGIRRRGQHDCLAFDTAHADR